MNYQIRRISVSDRDNLIKLFINSFNWKPSPDYINRKYDTALLGPVNTGFIAYSDEGNPAAYYGVFAVKLNIDGNIIQAAQSGDTVTHTEHRGKGLFIELAKHTYALCKQEGIDIVFGFPNKNSYPGFIKKLNWIHIHDIDVFSIKVQTLPIAKLVKKFPFFQNFYLNIIKLFLSKKTFYPDSFSSVINQGLSGVCRDEKYLKYRESKDKFFLNKYAKSWVKFDGALIIGDILNENTKSLESHIKWLKRVAFFTGCNKIMFCSSPGTILHNQFSKYAKVINQMPAGIMPVSDDVNVTDKIFFTSADFDNY
ncbi:MAG: GNAT family N-acetyltransferase [Bacteroidia bacterium]|jgi:hypothetical protein|nr:GNAT family N-acetyltransferase [Bacteroidia bacterium]